MLVQDGEGKLNSLIVKSRPELSILPGSAVIVDL